MFRSNSHEAVEQVGLLSAEVCNMYKCTKTSLLTTAFQTTSLSNITKTVNPLLVWATPFLHK